MIAFHGKPFLEYLIELVREQGFERVLLLLGYLPEVIRDYFGDGRRWGVRIDYSVSPVEDDTGRRVKLAEPLLDPVFLLMYCDNYWPMPFARMWQRFAAARVPALVTVLEDPFPERQGNTVVDEAGYVVGYDKSRSRPDVTGIDMGFMILSREMLGLLPSAANVSFETTVFPPLIARRELLGWGTQHRYF